MNTEENKKTVRKFYNEIMENGNLHLIDEHVADNFIDHEEVPGIEPNKNGIREWVQMTRTAFPDLKMDIEDMVAEGDKVVIMARMKGTHQGEFLGKKGTGRKLDWPMVDIIRFENGKVREHWGYSDSMKMMEQLQLDFSNAGN